MARPKGWRKEPARHALAAKGVKTMSNSPERGMKVLSPSDEPVGVNVLSPITTGLDALEGQNLRHEASGPGKFEGAYNIRLAEAFYDLTMDGFTDDEAGDVTETGMWAGFFADLTQYKIKEDGQPVEAAIVTEDSNGFFSYETFSDRSVAKRIWEKMANDLNY